MLTSTAPSHYLCTTDLLLVSSLCLCLCRWSQARPGLTYLFRSKCHGPCSVRLERCLAWGQQKTQARIMPGSTPADRGFWLKESMFLGPKLSESLKWGARQSRTSFFCLISGHSLVPFGFHLFIYISTHNPRQFFHPLTSEEKVFWEINVNKWPRMLGRGSTVAYGIHSINIISFPLTRVLFIKPDSINTWEFLGI